MSQAFTAIIKHKPPWWIGWVEEVPGDIQMLILPDQFIRNQIVKAASPQCKEIRD